MAEPVVVDSSPRHPKKGPACASPVHPSKNEQRISAGVAKILKNIDTESLLQVGDPKLQEVMQVRPDTVRVLALQCAFVSKSVDSLLKQTRTTRGFQIGIIGCGSVGIAIAETLLRTQWFAPEQLAIVSRHVPTVPWMEARGVGGYDSVEEMFLKHTPRLVLLACLPIHVKQVAKEMRRFVKASLLICSTVFGISVSKLQQLLGSDNVVKVSVPDAAIRHVRTQNVGRAEAVDLAVSCMVGAFDGDHASEAQVHSPTTAEHKPTEEQLGTCVIQVASEGERQSGQTGQMARLKLKGLLGTAAESPSTRPPQLVRQVPSTPQVLFASLVNQGTALGLDHLQARDAALQTLLGTDAGDFASRQLMNTYSNDGRRRSEDSPNGVVGEEAKEELVGGRRDSSAAGRSIAQGTNNQVQNNRRESVEMESSTSNQRHRASHSALQLPWDDASAEAFEDQARDLLEGIAGTSSSQRGTRACHSTSRRGTAVTVGSTDDPVDSIVASGLASCAAAAMAPI